MKQFKCKVCLSQFDEPVTSSVSYREYYGSRLWTDHNETCPDCHSLKIEQVYCLVDSPYQDEIEQDEYEPLD